MLSETRTGVLDSLARWAFWFRKSGFTGETAAAGHATGTLFG
jgi:hypothetical protein